MIDLVAVYLIVLSFKEHAYIGNGQAGIKASNPFLCSIILGRNDYFFNRFLAEVGR